MNIQKTFVLVASISLCTLYLPKVSAQNMEDTTGNHFRDDLLDHLVGDWSDSSTAHGSAFTSNVDVRWVLNHQYLLIHLKSKEIVPWWHTEMEYYEYIGYNHYQNRYTIHGMSIEGDEDLSEGFSYGYRDGNDFKTVAKFGADTNVVQHLIWHPETNTWNFQSRPEINGKEGEIFLDMKLTTAKTSSN